MKHNQNNIDDPWEIDIDFFTEKGMAPEWARAMTINSWLLAGDLRPLRAELAEPKLDRAFLAHQIFGMLTKLIDQDRLIVKPPKGGRPWRPDKFSRDVAAASLYEREIAEGKSAEAALDFVAEFLGMTNDNVRKVLTWFRKNWTASEK
jgi:hypothetical protein